MPHQHRSITRWAGLIALVSVLIPTIASAESSAAHAHAGFPMILRASGTLGPGGPTTFETTRFAAHTLTLRKEVAQAQTTLRAALALRAVRAAPPASVVRVSHTSPVAMAGYSGTAHADWYAIAACESSGRWDANTGNGYWGGLQFAPSTWFAYGGGPFDGAGPFPYSASAQIAVGERVLAAQGPGAWPSCYRSA